MRSLIHFDRRTPYVFSFVVIISLAIGKGVANSVSKRFVLLIEYRLKQCTV